MNLAIISDIHANREALDAVMDSIKKRSADRIICLGDIVNYGIDFDYCINVVKERVDGSLLGNHDSAIIGNDPLWNMNPEAQKSARWTMEQISEENKEFLSNLEIKHSENNMVFVHGTPGFPERWNYITSWFDAENQFDNFDERFCFIGHSHVPALYNQQEKGERYREGLHNLGPGNKFIINVGSVGQPRDKDPRACYVLLNEKMGTIEFVRVSYDVIKASQKIAAIGVSDFNAKRILVGI